MKFFCLKSLIVLASLVLVIPYLLAASLSLTQIGSLSTGGAMYSEWWYTETNPSLTGMAEAGASVAIDIDGTVTNVTADSSGTWTTTTTMDASDHAVKLTSGSETYSFTLHAGQDFPGDTTTSTTTTTATQQSTSTVPSTGFNQLAGVLLSTTSLALAFVTYLNGKSMKKEAYAKTVLKKLD